MSLRVKYNAFVFLLLLGAIGLLAYLSLSGIKSYQEEQLEGYLASQARAAHVIMGEKLSQDSAREMVRQLSVDRWMVTEVYGLKGALLSGSRFTGTQADYNLAEHEKAMAFAQSGKIAYTKLSLQETYGDPLVDYYAPLKIGEEQVGVLRMTYRYQNYLIFYNQMKGQISLAAAGVFAVSLLIGVWYFGKMTRAVKKLEISVDSVGRGHREGVHILVRNDELGRLSRGISDMSDTIFNQIERLEDEHVKLTLAVEKLKQMETKQRAFFGNITHEFKTPLSVINAYNDLAQMYPDDPQLMDTTQKQIRSEVIRLSAMVEQSLELAKFEKYDFEIRREAVDLKPLLKQVVERLSVKADKYNIQVNFEANAPAHILADSEALTQIFINLVDNAIKYNKFGGFLNVAILINVNTVEVAIEDSGVGIEIERLETIFEPFSSFRTDNLTEIKGSGLGLALVKRLVELQGGSIFIKSILGKGTKVHVCFAKLSPDGNNLETSGNSLEKRL